MKSTSKKSASKHTIPTSIPTSMDRSIHTSTDSHKRVMREGSTSMSSKTKGRSAKGMNGAHASTRSNRSDQHDDVAPNAASSNNGSSSTSGAADPTLSEVKIDKLVIVLYNDVVPDSLASAISDTLRTLVRKSKKRDGRPIFARGSTKGEIFKRVVIHRLPSGAVVKYAAEPSGEKVKQRLQITLNPGHLERPDVQKLERALAKILGLEWQRLIRSSRCTRIDACVDGVNVDIDSLLVTFTGARSQGTFYVQTDRDGRIGTYYLGSVQSATHGVVYDQIASEAYKKLVDEKLLQRQRVADDAEVVLKQEPKRTRFEVRSVFKPAIPLSALEKSPTALNKFCVHEISEKATTKLSAADLALIDVVRLRGLVGARSRLEKQTNGKATVDRLGSILARYAASWWDPQSFAQKLKSALRDSPVWALVVGPKR